MLLRRDCCRIEQQCPFPQDDKSLLRGDSKERGLLGSTHDGSDLWIAGDAYASGRAPLHGTPCVGERQTRGTSVVRASCVRVCVPWVQSRDSEEEDSAQPSPPSDAANL